jgi:Flp pilus assembly protein TadD
MARSPRPAAPKPSSPPVSSRPRAVLVSAGLVVLIALTYAPVRHYGLVSMDDPLYITQNLHVLGGLTWDNVQWAFTSRYASYWIPLTWVSYMTEVQMFGPRPDVMHITNVLLHAVNTLLLFTWLRRMTGGLGASACVAALFALHPLHVESVAWITERKDVLSTCFLLLTISTYSSYTRQPSAAKYLAVCGLAFAGLMAKPMLVTLPFLLLLCDVWPLGRLTLDLRSPRARARWWGLVREKWALFAMAAVASAVAFVTQQRGGAMVASEVIPFGLRVENAIVSAVIYLWQAAWPVDLIAWYAYPDAIPMWQVAAALAVLVAISFAVVRASKFPYLAVGWFWYLGTLVPVSGLIQVGLQPRADRFTYVPFIGLSIALVWGAGDLLARWRVRPAASVAVGLSAALACAVVANRQVAYWEDGLALWQHAADVTPGPGGAQAHFELARKLADAGRMDDAIAHCLQAIRWKPDWGAAYGVLGNTLMKAGRKAEAKAAYETALQLEPNQPEAQNNLGVMLAEEGHLEAALTHFAGAARLQPDFESAHANLGVALMRLGRKVEAVQEFSTVLRLNPANPLARQMLDALTRGK